ncbi:MAG: hypothetical protein MZV64_11810 [Ignavibacteriales bacterium]|nr:hypothetical protein [Ignavibacteriales bacterium]
MAVKEAMDAHGLKGTIKVFGSPAEEIVASRPYMIRAGLFEGVDAVIDNHSSSGFGTGYGVDGNALFSTDLHLQGQDGPLGRRALGRAERPRRRRDHERGHELSARAPARCPSACTTSSSRAARPPTSSPTRPASGTTSATRTSGSRTCTPRVVNCAKAGALAAGVELAGDAGRQRHPPAPRQQGRGRALPEEHRARRHARLERGGAGLRQGPAEGARGQGRGPARRRWRSSRRPAATARRRRLVRRRRRHPRRAHGDHHLPGLGARLDRPPLVQRRLLVRVDRLEGPQRRGQGHRRLGHRPPDQARGAGEAAEGVRGVHEDPPLQAVPAGRRHAAERPQQGADGQVPGPAGEGAGGEIEAADANRSSQTLRVHAKIAVAKSRFDPVLSSSYL